MAALAGGLYRFRPAVLPLFPLPTNPQVFSNSESASQLLKKMFGNPQGQLYLQGSKLVLIVAITTLFHCVVKPYAYGRKELAINSCHYLPSFRNTIPSKASGGNEDESWSFTKMRLQSAG